MFLLVIPDTCELLLCGNAEVQVRAVVELLDPFAARLGPTRAKKHLLRALQALYEVDDISVQTHLAQIPIVGILSQNKPKYSPNCVEYKSQKASYQSKIKYQRKDGMSSIGSRHSPSPPPPL